MAWQAVTSFTWPAASTAGTNIDVPFTAPDAQTKLVLLFQIYGGADGDLRADTARCIGYALSASVRGAIADASEDAAASHNSGRAYRDDACVIRHLPSNSVAALLDFVSMGDGTFRVVVDTQIAVDTEVVAVVFGGDDFTALAPQAINPGATSVTATGFTASGTNQGAFFISGGLNNTPQATLLDASWMFGVAYGSTPANYVLTGGANDGAATMQAVHYCGGDACILLLSANKTAVNDKASVTGYATDALTLSWAVSGGGTRPTVVIPFTCDSFAVGDFLTSTSTGALTPITGLGFTPSGVGLFSACAAENSGTTLGDDDRISVGFEDSNANVVAIASSDVDNVADAEVRVYQDADGSNGDTYNAVDSAGKYAGVSVALDSDGFTPTQTDADAVASFVWWLAVGAAAGGGPAAVPRRSLLGVGF